MIKSIQRLIIKKYKNENVKLVYQNYFAYSFFREIDEAVYFYRDTQSAECELKHSLKTETLLSQGTVDEMLKINKEFRRLFDRFDSKKEVGMSFYDAFSPKEGWKSFIEEYKKQITG